MAETKTAIAISSENTTEIINYENGNVESKLTISESYVGNVIRTLASGVQPVGPNVSGLEAVKTYDFQGFAATAGALVAGASISVLYDEATKATTITVEGSAIGLGFDSQIILDENLNVISSDTDFGLKVIAGAKFGIIGLGSAGGEAILQLGLEFKDGRIAINGEGHASIGLVVGEIDADTSVQVEVLDIENYCFAAGTSIEMADGTTKPIEDIKIDDMVLAFDPDAERGQGIKVSRRVTQLHQTENQPLINFHGLKVTPGHAFLTGDGDFKPVIEILEEDGTVVMSDGKAVRARTGWSVGSKEDRAIPVGHPDGDTTRVVMMRAGILYGGKDGVTFTIEQMMESRGYHLMSDGRFVNVDGDVKTAYWEWGVPDAKMIAGVRASYDDICEGSVIATGLPLAPSRPN